MNPKLAIETAIKKNIQDALIYIEDPRNDGVHLEASVVSKEFEDKTLLEQQRMVMNCLKELFQNGLHALALKTYTPEKWSQYGHEGNHSK